MINYGKFVKSLIAVFAFLVFIAKVDEFVALAVNENKYPSGIIINEILPSPDGPDEKEEWIEIFNRNNFAVDLKDWQIKDAAGKTKVFTFGNKITISPLGFLVLYRPETKITLNNRGDGLILTRPDGESSDNVSYEKSATGKSYNRNESGWVWSAVLTPGSANVFPLPVQSTAEEKIEPGKKTKEIRGLQNKNKLAAIGEQYPKKSFFLTPLIALFAAVFSGVVILIIKKKLKEI